MALMEEDKKLQQINITAPQQMNLFELKGDRDIGYSNTIELYDVMPKYTWAAKREFTDLDNAIVERALTVRRVNYKVIIKAAIISKGKDKNSNVLIYPGNREELVEDALRKLSCSGNGRFMDGQVGVLFTLYELQQELERMGHGFDRGDIREAIEVLRGASIQCIRDNETILDSNFFPMSGLQNRTDWMENGKDAKCYVQFNPLVTKSINELSFRQLNYDKCMSYSNTLARYLHKRLNHYWTQASKTKHYTIMMSTLILQSGRELSSRMSTNRRTVDTAIKAIYDNAVINKPEIKVIKSGNKIIDIKYSLSPTKEFISEIVKANWRQTKVQCNQVIGDNSK